jgi:hypothetical protein
MKEQALPEQEKPTGKGKRNLRVPPLVWELLCAAALVALAVFHFRDPLFADRFPVSEEYDTLILQYPVHAALDDALARGELPWWVPEAGNGLPLHAEGESGAMYPPNLLLFGLLPPFTAYALSLLLALVLLGVGTFGFARRLGADRPGALLAGTALMLSGFTLGHEHHVSLLRTAALLPWLLWLAEAHARRPRWLTVALGAGVVGLQWLAGNPQLAHLSAVVLLAYLPVRTALETAGNVKARLRAAGLGLAAAAAMIAAGMLLAGIQILPTWLYADETVRSGGLSLADATVIGYPARDLMLFLDPRAFGTPLAGGFTDVPGERNLFWESIAYVGLLPLLLAPVAFFRREHRGPAVLLGVLAVFGLLVALGRHSPVYRALFAIAPGFDLFRVPQRWLFVTALCLVALAALAVRWITDKLSAHGHPRAAVAVALGFVAFAAYDVARIGDRYYPTLDRAEVERPSPTAVAAAGEPLLAIPVRGTLDPARAGESPAREAGRDALALVSHSLNVAWNVRSPFQYVGLMTRRAQRYEGRVVSLLAASVEPDGVARPGPAWTAAVAASGARWVSSFVPIEAPGLTPAFRAEVAGFLDPVRVYRVVAARPRASLVAAIRQVPDETSALRALFDDPLRDPAGEAVVEVPADAILPPTPAPTGMVQEEIGTATVVRADATTLEVDVQARRDGWLVTTDAALAGWTAAVDGVETRLLPADVLGRAAWVPAGKHRVVFTYDPPGRLTGWIASGLGLTAVLAMGTAGLWRRRRPK